MWKVLSVLGIIFSLAVFHPPVSLGHGLGQILKKEADKYTIELEYESLELTADEPVEYGFRLIDKDSGKSADFESVTLRVLDKKDDRGVFSTNINAKDSIGLGPRVYFKLDEGDYSFKTAFFKGDEELARGDFDLTVAEGVQKRSWEQIGLGFGAGVILSGVLTYLLCKRKQ